MMARSLFLQSLVIGIMGVVVYFTFFRDNTPKVPEFDTNYWWGPNELKGKEDKTLKPFKVQFSDEMVKDLKYRLSNHRPWTPPLEGVAFEYGFNSGILQPILNYWRDSYDFQARQKFLNSYPQFTTNIQGLNIHFIRVKPDNVQGVQVIPLLLMHGWPGSVREFYEAIPLLIEAGKKKGLVFDLVVPSLPGYGFSSGAVRPGLGAAEVAVVMRNLMNRIGYSKFYVQGGDWGSGIGSHMSIIFPNEVLGYHSNMPFVSSTTVFLLNLLGSIYPPLIVEERLADRMYPMSKKYSVLMEEMGYMHLQATKPDTVGISLTDSPAGLASYILEKFSFWTNPEYKHLPDGGLTKRFTLDQLLDNLMIYWTNNAITTSMRLYSETLNKRHHAHHLDDIQSHVPTWMLQAKHELGFQPVCILKRKYPNLVNTTIIDEGGHFLAFELPKVFAEDVTDAIKAFREIKKTK